MDRIRGEIRMVGNLTGGCAPQLHDHADAGAHRYS
jgi:hypothetical protein